VAAGAGAAAVQVGLDVGLAQGHAGRAAVDHAADGRAVGFTEIGDCEKGAEGVAAHGHQRPGIRHYLFDYSPDMEYLEIVSPADFKTVDVEPVCPIPDPTPWA
jgi:hypothetical protein